ncbi:hypothetical protein [Burkholderia multivorans]|uniref:COG3904 family protein n=1 Tax=Burkholderia multivorans TaxID=87883 RepID=UPI0021BF54CB|nr:hypothetical protein [Burkholderia multivorans]
MKISAALTIALAALAFCSSAIAEELQITVAPYSNAEKIIEAPTRVLISGEIDADSPRRLKIVLEKIRNPWITVFFNSPGGNLLAGLEIGRLLRRQNATTYVGTYTNNFTPGPGSCFSACALAFLGGIYRFIPESSKYGVHRASLPSPSRDDFSNGQLIAAAVGSYIRGMGVDPALVELTMSAGPSGIYMLSRAELEQLKVVNNGRKSPIWTIEVTDGGTYLMGVQDSLYGTGKLIIVCDRKNINLISSYTAGQKSADIARGSWVHSLFIDEKTVALPPPIRLEAKGDWIYSLFHIPAETLRLLKNSNSIGHAMQLARSAPTFIGYRIDIDDTSRNRFNTYINNCLN